MQELKIIETGMKKLLGIQEFTYSKSKGGFLLSDGEFVDTTFTSHLAIAEYFDCCLDSLIILGVMRIRIEGELLCLEYVSITDKQKKILRQFLKDNSEKIKRVHFERSYGTLNFKEQSKTIFEILSPI